MTEHTNVLFNNYHTKRKPVKAVQWYPDANYGYFDTTSYGLTYFNRRIGTDMCGAEYCILEVGVRSDRGYQKIYPGDWIVIDESGNKLVVNNEKFLKNYE